MQILGINTNNGKRDVDTKSELDKSAVMVWVDSPAQSQMSLFLEYPFPRESVVMSLKKQGRSSLA